MKRIILLMTLPLLFSVLSGCASLHEDLAIMQANVGASFVYEDGSVVLAYPGPDFITDQSQVATLIVSNDYDLTVDGVLVRKAHEDFNPDLRLFKTANTGIYHVDLLPGFHKLLVAYVDPQPSGFSAKAAFGMLGRTDPVELAHTFQPGEVFVLSWSTVPLSSKIGIYPAPEKARAAIIANRNKARFE